ncbi:hypothetical protein BU16DRAFT_393241 [Lophium mytilinum]|uniref:Kelch repeat protein-like protein n=1 Tax=Lophium mytilinum TaxID=390894 RepID=A0A6A6QTQ7_9PEZI|nr:hypothetical protein BU16DRAFT_393241 [Lophium mytilinum]
MAQPTAAYPDNSSSMKTGTVEQPTRRRSVFMEVGLVDEEAFAAERRPHTPTLIPNPSPKRSRPALKVRFRSEADIFGHNKDEDAETNTDSEAEAEVGDYDSLATTTLSSVPETGKTYSRLYRLGILAFVLAVLLPLLQGNSVTGASERTLFGARGGVIPRHDSEIVVEDGFVKREDSPTTVCKRWSHQSAIVNGTLYIYGGRVTTDAQQTDNTWTNDFLTLDLTKSWQIGSPSLTGLAQPSGPPAVANGYLWNSLNSLFLYGGEFSDTPVETPTAFSTWEYDIPSSTWKEHTSPKSSGGKNAEGDGQAIQRAAEGAGFGVSALGRGWYFGGHLDYLTTEGWSIDVARVYLRSLVEFTFPGYSNDAVTSLENGKTAGEEGVYRNITEGGLQDEAGFTERADGLLLYVPGFGAEGILLGLTGGTNATFTQMNVIDVYDIANSTWYKQPTSGKTPEYRVNPCAVVAAAADGSSYNIHMFGGQNLQPYKEQTQYNDTWILSIPSFTWIPVDTSSQAVPYSRAGHSCNVWDGQMIVVGGYVGQDLSCDSPGIYVFNMSSLEWGTQFTALTGDAATKAWSGGGDGDASNPLSQQGNQRGFNASSGLEGSYGYQVPAVVQSIIGGNATGGATLTAPVQTPTAGPLATGKPITYTITGANGATVTTTAAPVAAAAGKSGPNIGAIIAGVIAGVFAVIAAYFAFCAWVYRKRVMLWKDHAQMAQRQNEKNDTVAAGAALIPPSSSGAGGRRSGNGSAKVSSERPPGSLAGSGVVTGSSGAATGSSGVDGIGPVGTGGGGSLERRSSAESSTEDLLMGQEPTFWGTRGVLLNPRRSLRVINRD